MKPTKKKKLSPRQEIKLLRTAKENNERELKWFREEMVRLREKLVEFRAALLPFTFTANEFSVNAFKGTGGNVTPCFVKDADVQRVRSLFNI